ncbi:TonB-dependent receptor [Filimonas lacunae]|nr:TonB-dependent receptor [Filimonas lacunae]
MATGFGQQTGMVKKVKLDVTQTTLSKVLDALDQQSEYSFNYIREDFDKMVVKDINIDNISLQDALQLLRKKAGIEYTVSGASVLFRKAAPVIVTPKKDPGKISGKIVDDENGQPVVGATIVIHGNTLLSDVEGEFVLALSNGSYTATVSFIGYGSKEVSDIPVKEDAITPLSITLKREKGQLSGIVVKSSARKESIAALFVKQKNAAGLSDGISAEQINATPDKHVGETLKRITGVSTNDNRKVVVRGIAERYNVAMLNGSTLPSTDIQERDFEFNLIPSNLVESIVVYKSATPDMPGFAGGLVQINTKSIPANNFTTISAGLSYNSRTQGKDFLGPQRGKYDYLGFDDGNRDHFPDHLVPLTDNYDPRKPDSQNKIKAAEVAAQNKRIGGTERLGTRVYQAMPSQNYQFSIGRNYSLSKNNIRSLGFVGSLSYRNTQSNDYIANMRRGNWSRQPSKMLDPEDVNTGNVYGFNTTWGVMLNCGFKTAKHQVSTYNLYTRIFDDRFTRIKGWTHEQPKGPDVAPIMEEDDRPKFSNLIQNKIAGEHQLGRFKLEWDATRTYLHTLEQDAFSSQLGYRSYANLLPVFQYGPQQASEPGYGNIHRDEYSYRERNLAADMSVAYNLKLGKTTHIFKTGFNILAKHATYNWVILPIVTVDGFTNKYSDMPIQEWGNHMTMENPLKDLFYNPGLVSISSFEGKSINRSAFFMFDSKVLPNLRLVGGMRAEYFRSDTLGNDASLLQDRNYKLYMDDSVRTWWLPSLNITYTPLKDFNVRASYSESVVRPGLMENARFARYNPSFGTILRSRGVLSTHVKNYDAKLEWFPGAGEILSVAYFYKYFDKPAEYYAYDPANTSKYDILITNSDWAKVRGWEFELRKNLEFLHPGISFLKDVYLSGNLTLQQSEVRARQKYIKNNSDGSDSVFFTYMKYPRALYGQVPVLYNLGMMYAGNRLGLSINYNHTGYKTFTTGDDPNFVEYERPRSQLDAQITYKLLKGKLEAKLNMSNLTDAPFRFFINDQSTLEYKTVPPGTETPEFSDRYQYKAGFSEKYEEGYAGSDGRPVGDRNSFTRYIGRTFSFTLSYHF